VEQDPCRPDVAPLVVALGDDLGRHVVGGADEFVVAGDDEFLLHVLVPLVGEAEVDERYLVVVGGVEEEVLGLEVPVADLLRVQVLQGFYDLHEDFAGAVLVEAPLLIDSVEQLASLAKTA